MICTSPMNDSPAFSVVDRRDDPERAEDGSDTLSTSSTSSIGKDSDESSGGGEGDGVEVQSEYKGGAFDSFDALEEVLPAMKSISKFYCGKSKSFTSLSDAASCSSVKDITKPENAYTRKRKNVLAYKMFWHKSSNNIIKSSHGTISKKPTNSRSMLALAAFNNCTGSNSDETSNSNSSQAGFSLPPLPPDARRIVRNDLSSSPFSDKVSSWRSFSLCDLQSTAVDDASSGIPIL